MLWNIYNSTTVHVSFVTHFLSIALIIATWQKEKHFTHCVTLWLSAAKFPNDFQQLFPQLNVTIAS